MCRAMLAENCMLEDTSDCFINNGLPLRKYGNNYINISVGKTPFSEQDITWHCNSPTVGVEIKD
jgi:hypothetical protein